jgi:hypothetical protein
VFCLNPADPERERKTAEGSVPGAREMETETYKSSGGWGGGGDREARAMGLVRRVEQEGGRDLVGAGMGGG